MTKKRTDWLNAAVIILTFLLILLTAQVYNPMIKKTMVAIFGGLSLLIQLVQFRNGGLKLQKIVLFVLTVAAMVMMFIVFSKPPEY
ncbi:hypothetical protein LAG90_00660 [Marinilongibacter aquaticus]|uniref:hypothetical protein n=1 Tax=Marinilongibacter aquaticus TaxID=2975157 RepID=UPI0021BD4E10|nr:hypothetical protein [Marinilongibacter aquaticus]UBM59169.1 hypothetical protein LAG90_00660 [Marinilongibacter aquaticus]